jgi:hypothetical protein
MSASQVSRAWSFGCCLTLILGLSVVFAPPVAQAQNAHAQPACCACHTWEDPVVERGEWHTIHALQKCCSACHGGNDRAIDLETAHAGLTFNPLKNPKLSCQHCHPLDYQKRTAGVVLALGLTPGEYNPAPFRGWDWPVELAVAIVVMGLGVMRWRRVHTVETSRLETETALWPTAARDRSTEHHFTAKESSLEQQAKCHLKGG